MLFHKVLDSILGNQAQIRILRTLSCFPKKEFTESELHRFSNVPQPTVHRQLVALKENGLVKWKRIGMANVCRLNTEHVIYPCIKQLFDRESSLVEEIKGQILNVINDMDKINVAVLFGSVSKGNERPDSDIDIFLLVENDSKWVEDKVIDLTADIGNRFGNPVSLFTVERKDLDDLKTKAIYDELKKGELILQREGVIW